MGDEASSKSAIDGKSFAESAQQAAASLQRQNALKRIGGVMAATAGVGAGARGLMGIYNLLAGTKAMPSGPAVVQVPYPEEEEAEMKAAESFMRGDYAKDISGIPWVMPATLLGGLGSLYGGWKGMDYILDNQRKKKLDEEVARAKGEFEAALTAQYDKQGSDLGRDLDALYDDVMSLTKQGIDWSHHAGQMAGAYGTYAGLSGLIAGLMAYQAANKRSRQALLQKAQQRRARRQQQQRPPVIFATPVPFHKAPALGSDELDGEPLDEAA